MEMRAIMNGWTQEGMNGVQEAVDSGWWKQHLAAAMCLVVARDFQNDDESNDSICILVIITDVIFVLLRNVWARETCLGFPSNLITWGNFKLFNSCVESVLK